MVKVIQTLITAFRKDEYFGDFVTKGEFITINLKDFGEIDGDMLNLYVNGILEVPQITLDFDYQKFIINLQMGFNTIEFTALNEGELYPNTTQYIVMDYLDVIKRSCFCSSKRFQS